MQDNIIVKEFSVGYPFILPEPCCPLIELKNVVTTTLKRSDLISPAIQLSNKHDQSLHNYLLECKFIVDETEVLYERDLVNYNQLVVFEDEYKFLNFEECGSAPFLEVTNNVSSIRRMKTQEGLKNLQGDYFDPRLWIVAYLAEKPIGIILCEINKKNNHGTIVYISVIDSYQNKGIGKKLHLKALALLKEFGVCLKSDFCIRRT
ncbi:MAG: GNAT family N-acetyltransferase [Oligoflexia bacterium]|nr:GNAT family N-acetyltransferase [Oligoflexia bacterium]